MTKKLGRTAVAILVAVSLLSSACTARRLEPGDGPDSRAVLAAFTTRGLSDHLEALQRIADNNGGNRATGTSGYEASARYVEEQLRAAGYTPVRQTFTFKEDRRNRNQVESFNILAETGGSAANTVVVGGHLDSVRRGPGLNDNASGVA
ncbi:MAG TPA: M28 family peptidase, partial [Arthrobacter sp.]